MTWTQNDAQFWRAVARSIERDGYVDPPSYRNNRQRWGRKRDGAGLCWVLWKAYEEAGMPLDQYERLTQTLRINSGHGKDWVGFYFPLTRKGDAQRRNLCLKLAAMAEADGGNHKETTV